MWELLVFVGLNLIHKYDLSLVKGKTLVDDETAYRFSSFANLLQNNGTLKLNKGFQTCRTIKIIVESQLNGGNGKRIEIYNY